MAKTGPLPEGPNHALLTGMVWGALAQAGLSPEMEQDEDGNYTTRLIVTKPSGKYAIYVVPMPGTEP